MCWGGSSSSAPQAPPAAPSLMGAVRGAPASPPRPGPVRRRGGPAGRSVGFGVDKVVVVSRGVVGDPVCGDIIIKKYRLNAHKKSPFGGGSPKEREKWN